MAASQIEVQSAPPAEPRRAARAGHHRRRTTHLKRFRSIVVSTAFSMIVGALFAALADGLRHGPLINGIVAGGLIGAIGSTVELYLFQQRFRRLRFSAVLALRSLFYLALIVAVTLFVILRYVHAVKGSGFVDALSDPDFIDFVVGGRLLGVIAVATLGSILINFLRQVNRLLGQNVLVSFITGRYHQPIVEERIFMFLDLRSSTTLAESLGHDRYHHLLNDFFYDITEPIVECRGEIYQYVGDEVVITWPAAAGTREANCLRCFFAIVETIAEHAPRYIERYGVVPGFKAGMHVGPVVVAEVGDIKREIAFHGDAINTTARIQAECNALRRELLISRDLLARVALPAGLTAERIADVRLRGKLSDVELYSVR
jgi:adenylate cyclase